MEVGLRSVVSLGQLGVLAKGWIVATAAGGDPHGNFWTGMK
jgi:hypothetical protein